MHLIGMADKEVVISIEKRVALVAIFIFGGMLFTLFHRRISNEGLGGITWFGIDIYLNSLFDKVEMKKGSFSSG